MNDSQKDIELIEINIETGSDIPPSVPPLPPLPPLPQFPQDSFTHLQPHPQSQPQPQPPLSPTQNSFTIGDLIGPTEIKDFSKENIVNKWHKYTHFPTFTIIVTIVDIALFIWTLCISGFASPSENPMLGKHFIDLIIIFNPLKVHHLRLFYKQALNGLLT